MSHQVEVVSVKNTVTVEDIQNAGGKILNIERSEDGFFRADVKVRSLNKFLEAMNARYDYDENGYGAFFIGDTDSIVWVEIEETVQEITLCTWECKLCGAVFTQEPIYDWDGSLLNVEEHGCHEETCPVRVFGG